eukprot:GHVL01028181.1.p1 GENE.GHVL01028181.1~~GHVL01028181.1.p1  ORF type:complete len:562 (+),score=106.74 GHVL01028181.1:147-1832(+)
MTSAALLYQMSRLVITTCSYAPQFNRIRGLVSTFSNQNQRTAGDRLALLGIQRRVDSLIQPLNFLVLWCRDKDSSVTAVVTNVQALLQEVSDFLQKELTIADGTGGVVLRQQELTDTLRHYLEELNWACNALNMAISVVREFNASAPAPYPQGSTTSPKLDARTFSLAALLRASQRFQEIAGKSGDVCVCDGRLYRSLWKQNPVMTQNESVSWASASLSQCEWEDMNRRSQLRIIRHAHSGSYVIKIESISNPMRDRLPSVSTERTTPSTTPQASPIIKASAGQPSTTHQASLPDFISVVNIQRIPWCRSGSSFPISIAESMLLVSSSSIGLYPQQSTEIDNDLLEDSQFKYKNPSSQHAYQDGEALVWTVSGRCLDDNTSQTDTTPPLLGNDIYIASFAFVFELSYPKYDNDATIDRSMSQYIIPQQKRKNSDIRSPNIDAINKEYIDSSFSSDNHDNPIKKHDQEDQYCIVSAGEVPQAIIRRRLLWNGDGNGRISTIVLPIDILYTCKLGYLDNRDDTDNSIGEIGKDDLSKGAPAHLRVGDEVLWRLLTSATHNWSL